MLTVLLQNVFVVVCSTQTSLAWPDSWIGSHTCAADQGSGYPLLHHLCYWNVIIKENLRVRDVY